MQYTAKDYEFLGKAVAAGKYVTKSVCLVSCLCALLVGGIIGYTVNAGFGGASVTKRVVAGNEEGTSNFSDAQNRALFEAITQMEKKLQANPQDIASWVQLGHLFFDSHNFEKAVNAYEKALAIDPKMPDVLVDCGIMYRALGKFDTALDYFARAKSIDPKHPQAIFNTGIVLFYDLGRKKEGVQQWKELAAISPDHTLANGRTLAEFIRENEASIK